MSSIKIKNIERAINYQFKNKEFLVQASTHSSYRHDKDFNNEKLEFLGDAVLQMVISEILYKEYPEEDEGGLTKLRASVINNRNLGQTVKKLRIQRELRMGEGQLINDNILSDYLEAIIGAVYLDDGIKSAYQVISDLNDQYWIDVAHENMDFKSQLQEYTQKFNTPTKPNYELIESTGPAHNRLFKVAVLIDNNIMGKGKGPSKKIAEQNAAKECLTNLSKNKKPTT